MTDPHELAEALTAFTSYAAQKMRRQGLATAALMVFLHTNRHSTNEPQHSGSKVVRLTIGTADTARLIRAALWGLKGILRPGYRWSKCGVILLNLAPADQVQGSLFLRPDEPGRVALMLAIDAINRRYGRDRVRFACSGTDRPWKLKAEFHSLRYTTRWNELLSI